MQSDTHGDSRVAEIAAVEAACEAAGAVEIVVTDDPDEGEMFVAARRAAFPAVEARGALLLEDAGVPVPLLPDLLAAMATPTRSSSTPRVTPTPSGGPAPPSTTSWPRWGSLRSWA